MHFEKLAAQAVEEKPGRINRHASVADVVDLTGICFCAPRVLSAAGGAMVSRRAFDDNEWITRARTCDAFKKSSFIFML